jgi:hypothetical protein
METIQARGGLPALEISSMSFNDLFDAPKNKVWICTHASHLRGDISRKFTK